MQCVGPNTFNTAAYDTERLQLDDKVWRMHRKAKNWRSYTIASSIFVYVASTAEARPRQISLLLMEFSHHRRAQP